jgi:NAD(P)H dehydrogenase (quinone)
MNHTLYGITGATGQLGRLVVAALKPKANEGSIVALVRDPEKAQDLGVEARAFDYDQPESLAGALAGIDTLLLISSNEIGKRVAQHKNVIAAAKAAGVKRIVYTSLLRTDASPLNIAGEHAATEEALKASGVPYAILRNGWYTENYTASIPSALGGGAFMGSAGEGRISSAAREDYAEAAVVVLVGEGHEGRTYELAGDESYTLAELAAEISKQTGREIPYRDIPGADFARALASFGIPEPFSKALASWDVAASQGALFDEGHELSRLIGRPTTPLSISVNGALKSQA